MLTTSTHHTPTGANRVTPDWTTRLALMLVNGLVFQLAYSACDAAAARAQVTRHVATAWDAQTPLIPWMVLPYLVSAPLLALGFFLAVDRHAVRAYSQRLLLTTAFGCLVFALWPLSFQGARPVPADEPWSTLYRLLHAVDGPFNQCPSLHVAFMVVLWPTARTALRTRLARTVFALALSVVAAATVFTHQHHLLDLPAGVLLGLLACRFVPARREEPAVALHYGVAAIVAVVMTLTLQPVSLRLGSAWLAVCAAAVAWAYVRGDAQFLHKRDGRFPLWSWLLYGPYLVGYQITWALVRWRERHQTPVWRCGPQLLVGRRLSSREASALLPAQCTVIDLANELTETRALRVGASRRYHAVAMLDLRSVPAAARAQVLQLLQHEHEHGRTVFLHCAMGYHRSRDMATAFLTSRSRRET